MMYKNLPLKVRGRVVFSRMCMDGMIACVYLLTGKLSFFKAVVRAHKDYRKMRRDVQVSGGEAVVPRAKVSLPFLALRGFRYPDGSVGD